MSYSGSLRVSYPVSAMRNTSLPPGPPPPRPKVVLNALPPPFQLPLPVLGKPMPIEFFWTRPIAPLPMKKKKKKSTSLGKKRKASAKSINKNSNAMASARHNKQSRCQKKSNAPPRATRSRARAAPAFRPVFVDATPPGDRSSAASSPLASSPTPRRSTRNPQHTPALASGSCTTTHPPAPSAAPTPAFTGATSAHPVAHSPAPPPAAVPSPSGKRKREDNADDTPTRPTRRRKPTARALEALEAPAPKLRKPRARRNAEPAAHSTASKPPASAGRKAQPKGAAAQPSSPLPPAVHSLLVQTPLVVAGSRKRSLEADDDGADGVHVEVVVADGGDARTTGSHARRASTATPAPKRRRA